MTAKYVGLVYPEGVCLKYRKSDGTIIDTCGNGSDPSTETLTGWWRTDYSASPWVGQSSVGASGGRNLTEGTHPPSTGTAVNGHVPADFNGTNQQLTGSAIGNYISSTGWEVHGLISIDTCNTNWASNQGYAYPAMLTDDNSGNFYVAVCAISSVPYIVAGHYDGVSWKEIKAPITFTTLHCFQALFDGTDLNLIIDGGTPTTQIPAGNASISGSAIKVGRNYNSGVFLDGRIFELLTFSSQASPTIRGNNIDYFNARYLTTF